VLVLVEDNGWEVRRKGDDDEEEAAGLVRRGKASQDLGLEWGRENEGGKGEHGAVEDAKR
jgi:hypothetical protein